MNALLSKVLLACTLVLALSACMATRLHNLNVSVASIKELPASDGGAQLELTLHYNSENVIPLAIAGGDYKLYLNGQYIGKCRNTNAVGVPALKVVVDTVTLRVEKPELLASIRASAKSGTVSYRLVSRLYSEFGEEKIDLQSDFSETTTFTE